MLLLLHLITKSYSYLGEECPLHQCETNYLNSTDDKCISVNSTTVFVSSCEADLYCEIPGSGQDGYCQSKVVSGLNSLPYPGESCSDLCRYGACVEGVCQGSSKETYCSKTQECDVDLSCRENLCLPLISEGEKGCYNDYDCVNNAGCSSVNSDGSGKCIRYFSVNKQDEVDTCYGNKNLLCESGSCGAYGEKFVCLAELRNSLESPYLCNTNDYCYTNTDSFTGIYLTGKCRCGLDGNAYCGLFNGDAEVSDFKTHSRAWTKTQEIHKCHSVRRWSQECIDEKWDDKKNSYLYYEEYVKLYPKVIGADECVVDIYFGEYAERESSYSISGAGTLIVAGFFLFS